MEQASTRPEFAVGDCVIVHDDASNQWHGKKGKIIAIGVVKGTVGYREVGKSLSESKSVEVHKSHYVLFDSEIQAVLIEEACLAPRT